MKDIELMHYFLGMEVWQEDGHIFLGQGKYAVVEKYAVDILKRFQMEDCRPMTANWKKLMTFEGELVDPTKNR